MSHIRWRTCVADLLSDHSPGSQPRYTAGALGSSADRPPGPGTAAGWSNRKDSEHTDSLQERPDRAVRNSSSVGTRGSRQKRMFYRFAYAAPSGSNEGTASGMWPTVSRSARRAASPVGYPASGDIGSDHQRHNTARASLDQPSTPHQTRGTHEEPNRLAASRSFDSLGQTSVNTPCTNQGGFVTSTLSRRSQNRTSVARGGPMSDTAVRRQMLVEEIEKALETPEISKVLDREDSHAPSVDYLRQRTLSELNVENPTFHPALEEYLASRRRAFPARDQQTRWFPFTPTPTLDRWLATAAAIGVALAFIRGHSRALRRKHEHPFRLCCYFDHKFVGPGPSTSDSAAIQSEAHRRPITLSGGRQCGCFGGGRIIP